MFCTLKTSTENTAIFINVIHGVLRAAYFLSFLFPFLGAQKSCVLHALSWVLLSEN